MSVTFSVATSQVLTARWRGTASPARLTHVLSITAYPRHEPALIAAARLPDNRGFRCGTFSQAELTADRVITRFITRSRRCPPLPSRAYPGPGR